MRKKKYICTFQKVDNEDTEQEEWSYLTQKVSKEMLCVW